MMRSNLIHSCRHGLVRGFSLIEMIIVIVVLSIGAVALLSMQGQVVRGQADDNDIQTGAQLLQECGEQILATRRRGTGYDSIVISTDCYLLAGLGGFTAPSVDVTPYTGTGCPAGATCKLAVISVSKGGATLTSRLMVVDY